MALLEGAIRGLEVTREVLTLRVWALLRWVKSWLAHCLLPETAAGGWAGWAGRAALAPVHLLF